jgi:antimicrobial peptide system SdpA family protein
MKSLTFFRLSVIGIWLVILYFVTIAAVPNNPLSPSKLFTLRAKMLLPEAWNFFTRDPREEKVFIYSIDSLGRSNPIESWPNNSLNNLLGIRRTARAVGTDYGMILSKVPDSMWETSKEKSILTSPLTANQRDKGFVTRYPNDSSKHILTGEYLFIKKAIIPWSWYRRKVVSDPDIKYIYGVIEE